jgi:hypothetical protein
LEKRSAFAIGEKKKTRIITTSLHQLKKEKPSEIMMMKIIKLKLLEKKESEKGIFSDSATKEFTTS